VDELLTEHARIVIQEARRAVASFRPHARAPMMVFIPLIFQRGSIAARMLAKFGFDHRSVKEACRDHMSTSPEHPVTRRQARSPTVDEILDVAREESKQLGHTWIGTEHILLSLLRDSECEPARMLGAKGISHDSVRAGLIRLIGDPAVADAGAVTATRSALLGAVRVQFTDHARESLAHAYRESERTGRDLIGTEHVLVGLLESGGRLAAMLLSEFQIDLRRVRSAIDRFEAAPQGEDSSGCGRQSSRTSEALTFANERARRLNHDHISSVHLLLAILQNDDNGAAQVLSGLGVDPRAVRIKLAGILDHPM
jgi:ATP-dependent Clp protease ATP-binding subunit ClpA